MKTLKEEVEQIVKSTQSKRAKQVSLIKLGLRSHEVTLLLGALKNIDSKTFNANSLTFGVEIECYNVDRETAVREIAQRNISIQNQSYNHNDNINYYKLVSDCSIVGKNPVECVSPILKGNKGLDSLKNVCDALNIIGAKVNRSTGLHIHFGASSISDAHYIRIFKNYAKLENVIDGFLPLSRRSNENRFCKGFAGISFASCTTKSDVHNTLDGRYFKVNAEAYYSHKTIEFRHHSGTTDYLKIKNWINFLRKLINYSATNEIERCSTIEDIPFLTLTEKNFFIERRNLFLLCV